MFLVRVIIKNKLRELCTEGMKPMRSETWHLQEMGGQLHALATMSQSKEHLELTN
jgi:hypothetical protein